MRVLGAVNGSGPLYVEENSLLPQLSALEPTNKADKARLPSAEVFFIAEFNESRTTPTCFAGSTTGFDFDRIRHGRTVRKFPEPPSFVDQVEENGIEVARSVNDPFET
nr:hypothetical protein [Brevibacterium aurantiacum]